MAGHACDPSIREAEAGGSQVQDQPELCSLLLYGRGRAVVAHAFNPRTGEAEAGGFLWIQLRAAVTELVRGGARKL